MESVISTQWRMLAQPSQGGVVPRGLDALWHQIDGRAGRLRRRPRHFLQAAERILAREQDIASLPDGRLRGMMAALRPRFQLQRDTPADREEAFAILREVAARSVGLRPYREQVAAALALEAGGVVEMATGEGKTLVATLPAILAGWRGRGCHVITANDYLAARDADLMQAVYRFCGLSVGCITQEMPADARKQAYSAHVTYATNKEVAADFLRDRLLKGGLSGLPAALLAKIAGRGDRIDRLVQRGLECAIVDEADSVFIDEAATPLLISGQGTNQEQVEAYEQAMQLAGQLDPARDYKVDRQAREIRLTAAGQTRLAELADPLGGLWKGRRRREELIRQSLAARKFFLRGKHYVVEDDKVVIVDEFTGRVMPERTWRDGLHQAVEAKEGLPINLPKETHARISFQRFFRMYRKLAGMSGTVAEARSELWGIYRLPVIAVPTHRPCRRIVMPDRVFTTAAAKWEAVIEAVDRLHQTARPILIGTGSISESEHLSSLLTARHLKHRLLNATRQDAEAAIIAAAGRKGQITVATNMAGRGTDIKLGAGVAECGGLHVIATQRFEARRIDRQLFGRCARQGDPGSCQAFISLEDELVQKHRRRLTAVLRHLRGRTPQAEISSAGWRRRIAALQRRAERISGRMRQDVLGADNWLDDHLGFAANEL
ncbi:MAG: prepilin peptidase [Desulfobacterales bacterium]|jgi:preprotein translocase subunit SecA